MDTSLDTTPKMGDGLFSYTLRGKKLEKDNHFPDQPWEILLEEYLRTENPEYLFKAINFSIHSNNNLLQYPGRDLGEEEYLRAENENTNDPEYLDGSTIVWESIRNWQWWIFYGGVHRKELRKEAKKNLRRIGQALIPTETPRSQYPTEDGLAHIYPQEKGKNYKLTFNDHPLLAKKYFNEFENKLKVFHERHKKRYAGSFPERRKRQDYQEIIKEEFGEEINLDELKRFELYDYRKATASYMAWKHRKICQKCNKKKIGNKYEYETFLNIHKEAKKFLSVYEQPLIDKC